MTSSSTDTAVFRGLDGDSVRSPRLDTDLRSGGWTRLGAGAVLGDAVTESLLQGLAETARAAAQAQGYAVGWAQGRAAADERARVEAQQATSEREAERTRQAAEHAQAVATLRAAAELLERRVAEACAAVESQAVEVALQLTEAVLGREVALATDPGLDAVRRALALLPTRSVATVRLHPQDRAAVDADGLRRRGRHAGPAEHTGLEGLEALGGHAVTLVDDPSLSRGDAVVETDTQVIDATVGAALARVREVLAS